MLILDEATSSIDTRTEMLVQQGMDGLRYGRTTFVIAHRLSTVQNADAIMVLDHGRIIERGTHEDLIKLKGTYYQLYTGALELINQLQIGVWKKPGSSNIELPVFYGFSAFLFQRSITLHCTVAEESPLLHYDRQRIRL